MIFRKEFLSKIEMGAVTIAYRRWKKLSVKVGGTLKTSIGVLQFTGIKKVSQSSLSESDAKRAGFDDLESLLKEMNSRTEGQIYKIQFKLIGKDPRLTLQTQVSAKDLKALIEKLKKMDKLSHRGPWIQKLLKLINKYPGVSSRELAQLIDYKDTLKFKLQVRKLKALGLTISLGTGYKLSPRGKKILSLLNSAPLHQ